MIHIFILSCNARTNFNIKSRRYEISIAILANEIGFIYSIKEEELNELNENGENPIEEAILKDKPSVLKVLFDKAYEERIDFKRVAKAAVKKDSLKIYRAFKKIGFNLLKHSLKVAKEEDKYEAILKILDIMKVSEIERAVLLGDLSLVKRLINKSFDKSLLVLAAWDGNIEIVTFLLEQGGQINFKELEKSKTALHISCEEGNIEIVELLLHKGANVNIQDFAGNTPIMLAVQKGNIDIVNILISVNADIKIENMLHSTPLIECAKRGHAEILKILLRLGAPINDIDGQGLSPIIYACTFGHIEVVKVLLENGVNIACDPFGNTPLSIAYQQENHELIELLEKYVK